MPSSILIPWVQSLLSLSLSFSFSFSPCSLLYIMAEQRTLARKKKSAAKNRFQEERKKKSNSPSRSQYQCKREREKEKKTAYSEGRFLPTIAKEEWKFLHQILGDNEAFSLRRHFSSRVSFSWEKRYKMISFSRNDLTIVISRTSNIPVRTHIRHKRHRIFLHSAQVLAGITVYPWTL